MTELTGTSCATAQTVMQAYFGSTAGFSAGWSCTADATITAGRCSNGAASFRFRRS